jgi:hypothetical protein
MMEEQHQSRAALVVAVAALISLVAIIVTIALGSQFLPWVRTGSTDDLFLSKFHVVVGLPAAAIAAFVIVVFLRQASGPIEFEGFGFKFRGASGQVVLWIGCFLTIVGAIKWLW